jgi:acyl-ACP thioesterase
LKQYYIKTDGIFGIMFRMDNYGEYTFKVRTYECGPDGFATMPAVCNYLQEAAALNAEELKFSKSNFDAAGENISWVLTRMRIEMDKYPKWGENVSVLTFPRGGRKIAAWRDFLIKDSEGNVIGRAASEWMLIDLSTRRIVQIPQAVFDAANTEREPVLGEEPFTAKLRFPNHEAKDAGTFKACNFHIDLNGHVNNVHYVSWLLEPLGEKRPCGIELLFRGETVCGETVSVKTALDAGQAYHAIFSEIGKESVVAKISIAP